MTSRVQAAGDRIGARIDIAETVLYRMAAGTWRDEGNGRCCINRNEVMAIPIPRTSQTFTDTGMPRSDITFSADALIHASVFCCASTRAFMAHPMMRL